MYMHLFITEWRMEGLESEIYSQTFQAIELNGISSRFYAEASPEVSDKRE